MNAKIPLLSIAATLSTGCIDELLKAAEEEEENEEDTGEGINGDWSLLNSIESCYEDSYTYDGTVYYSTYCVSFSIFNMTIVEEEITSSEVVAEMTQTLSDGTNEESYSSPYETEAYNLSGEGTEYSLEIADEEITLDCTLSGATLECEGIVDDGTLSIQVTLTK